MCLCSSFQPPTLLLNIVHTEHYLTAICQGKAATNKNGYVPRHEWLEFFPSNQGREIKSNCKTKTLQLNIVEHKSIQ